MRHRSSSHNPIRLGEDSLPAGFRDSNSVATSKLREHARRLRRRRHLPELPYQHPPGDPAHILPITYRDTDREEWIAAMVASGVPAEYAQVLRPLTTTIASGNGARPNGDVLEVTGVPPVAFAEFAARTAPAWK